MKDLNVLIAGVGGQGTLLACRIIGNAGLATGRDIKASEVHGMAQRGGSVISHVKIAEKVHSPLIEKGDADLILGFEPLEALRWIDYLKKDGRVITNTKRVNPMPVITGQTEYPADISEKIGRKSGGIIEIDAHSIALEAGNPKAANMVLIGVMASLTDISEDIWIGSIRENVPARSLDTNLKAFQAGIDFAALMKGAQK